MSKVEVIAPFILSFEGGYVNDPDDKGGATNKGVTLNTWRSVGYDKDGDGDIDVDDLKKISNDDAVYRVLKPFYWDKLRCDDINNQAIANMMSDWAYCSGYVTVAKAVQRILGVTIDGIVGPKTIKAINSADFQITLFYAIKNARVDFLNKIVDKNPSQKKFINGWLRRVDSIRFYTLIMNDGKVVTL